jgi:recombination DNA repair RAD52 pathway protein
MKNDFEQYDDPEYKDNIALISKIQSSIQNQELTPYDRPHITFILPERDRANQARHTEVVVDYLCSYFHLRLDEVVVNKTIQIKTDGNYYWNITIQTNPKQEA